MQPTEELKVILDSSSRQTGYRFASVFIFLLNWKFFQNTMYFFLFLRQEEKSKMLFTLHEPQATASKMLTLEAAWQRLTAVQY